MIRVINISAFEVKTSQDEQHSVVTNNDLTPHWKNIGTLLNNEDELARYRRWLGWFVKKSFNKDVSIVLEYSEKDKPLSN